jgi:hypothetical protein
VGMTPGVMGQLQITVSGLAPLGVGRVRLQPRTNEERHGCGRRGPRPVILAGREPDHITGLDFLGSVRFALDPDAARRDNESRIIGK